MNGSITKTGGNGTESLAEKLKTYGFPTDTDDDTDNELYPISEQIMFQTMHYEDRKTSPLQDQLIRTAYSAFSHTAHQIEVQKRNQFNNMRFTEQCDLEGMFVRKFPQVPYSLEEVVVEIAKELEDEMGPGRARIVNQLFEAALIVSKETTLTGSQISANTTVARFARNIHKYYIYYTTEIQRQLDVADINALKVAITYKKMENGRSVKA